MMKNLPLISVIVPAYNAQDYLERCMESVKAQTYPNWELVVVNDGSVDATAEILDSAARMDTRVQAIHTPNGGVCSARNRGIEAARGEYIAFLDVDDELEPMALERLHGLCEECSCDMAIGQCKRIKSDKTILESRFPKNKERWIDHEALTNSLKDHPALYSVWGKLYKRSLIGDTRFVEGRKIHEDSFFLFEICCKKPTVEIRNEYLYRYHITDNSASRAVFSEKFLDILHFAERKQAIIEQEYPFLAICVPNLLIKANMALLQNLTKSTDSRYRALEKQCIKTVIRYKKQFVPASKANRRWFFIITHHLYRPYKWILMQKQA